MMFRKGCPKSRFKVPLTVLVLRFGFWITLAGLAQAETKITNPSDLRPRHILEKFSVVAPDYLVKLIKENDFNYNVGTIGDQQIAIFSERQPCPSYGCSVVLLKATDDRLFDPIIFFSHEARVPFSYTLEKDIDGVVFCLTGQMAYAC